MRKSGLWQAILAEIRLLQFSVSSLQLDIKAVVGHSEHLPYIGVSVIWTISHPRHTLVEVRPDTPTTSVFGMVLVLLSGLVVVGRHVRYIINFSDSCAVFGGKYGVRSIECFNHHIKKLVKILSNVTECTESSQRDSLVNQAASAIYLLYCIPSSS